MIDLRDLARISQERLASLPPKEEQETPLDLHEATLLVKSIAPPAVAPAKVEVAEEAVTAEAVQDAEEAFGEVSRPVEVAAASPARRRWRAAYSGVALLIVMASLAAAKAKIAREKSFAAMMTSGGRETAAQVSSTAAQPAADLAIAASEPGALPSVGAAPTSTPRKTPVIRPVAPRPRAPAPVDTTDPRASAGSDGAPHIELLDAMQAAVARHSAPPGVVKGDCPPAAEGGSGAPSPCARGAPRTSPLHP